MPTRIGDITQAFEFANTNGDIGGFRAFVCRQTGKIYYQFEDDDLQDLEDDKLPDDIENATKYLPLPDKRDLGLGKPLVLAFIREFLPDGLDDVRYFFSKRGAYPKFKALLAGEERSSAGMRSRMKPQNGLCAIGASSIPSKSPSGRPFECYDVGEAAPPSSRPHCHPGSWRGGTTVGKVPKGSV